MSRFFSILASFTKQLYMNLQLIQTIIDNNLISKIFLIVNLIITPTSNL